MPLPILVVIAAAATAAPSPAPAASPTFECSKASGSVEALICADDELAAMDHRLSDTYRAALRKSRPPEARTLTAEQRGWIKGRNDCWKAGDVRGCVAEAYRDRIAELQASWALVPGKGPVFYRCDDGSEVVATYFATDPPTARAERGDQQQILRLTPAASGARYAGRNVVFWTKGDEAMVAWGVDAETIGCRATGGP